MKSADLRGALRRQLPRLWIFALRLVGDETLAEELVHRSCLVALRREDELPAVKETLLWLLMILHSVWQSDFRVRGIRCPVAEPQPAQVRKKNHRQNEHRKIVDAVADLPDVQRFAMLLVTVEGISIEDASEVLGITIPAMQHLLSQARLTIGSYRHTAAGRAS